MDKITAHRNIGIIFRDPQGIFVADNDGKIARISRFNLIGRFVEWIKDLSSKGERSARTSKVVRETMDTILRNLENDPKNNFYFTGDDTPLFPGFKVYTYNHPMSDLADKMINTHFNNMPEIKEKIVKIKNLTLPILNDLNETEKNKLFHECTNV